MILVDFVGKQWQEKVWILWNFISSFYCRCFLLIESLKKKGPFQAPECATVPRLDGTPFPKIRFDGLASQNIYKSCQNPWENYHQGTGKYFGYWVPLYKYFRIYPISENLANVNKHTYSWLVLYLSYSLTGKFQVLLRQLEIGVWRQAPLVEIYDLPSHGRQIYRRGLALTGRPKRQNPPHHH